MRIIVCGCRLWNDPWAIEEWLMELQEGFGKPYDAVTIVHGAARGADRIADTLAKRMGFTVEPHEADWAAYNKAAGAIRNYEMLKAGADAVVAFKDFFNWRLDHGGTENMIDIAHRAGVPCEVRSHISSAIPGIIKVPY